MFSARFRDGDAANSVSSTEATQQANSLCLLPTTQHSTKVETAPAQQVARSCDLVAAERPIWVAGSISSKRPSDSGNVTPTGPEAAAGFHRQGEILAQAGVDLIITEMMSDIPNATIVTEAALATGLPVWHGFSAELSEDGLSVVEWREGFFVHPREPFDDLVATITGMGGEAAGVMLSYTRATTLALEVVRAHWSGPLLAYAETGHLHYPNWVFDDAAPPDEFAAQAKLWAASGVQIIGGCCGTNPKHIRKLRETLLPFD